MIKLDPLKDIHNPEVTPIWELHQEGGRTRPIDREILFKNLCDFVDILEKHNIKYCISHGTMLGLYRDGNFIPWDDDIDLSLLDFNNQREYFKNYVRKDIIDAGFYMPEIGNPNLPVCATGPNANMPYYDSVAIKDGEKIECWWFEKKGNYYIYDEARSKNDLKHSAKYYDEPQDFKWRGRTWKIPNHIEDWLVMMYGRSWNIPQPDRKYNNQKFDSNGNCITDVS